MILSGRKSIELGTLGQNKDIGVIGIFPFLLDSQIDWIRNDTDLGETAMDQSVWFNADHLYTELLFELEDADNDSVIALARQIVQALAQRGIKSSLREVVYDLEDKHQALFMPRSLD
jgi:hypothetical protein